MFRKILTVSITTIVLASCASKSKHASTDPSASAASDAAPVIKNEPLESGLGSDSGKIPGLGSIFFEYDQARLTDSARKQLQSNADWIKGNAGTTVQIEGHTDERGSVEYNLSLGERRAKSVKAYLASLGIDGKRMTIISYGEEKPLEAGDNESAYSKNRRANFVPLRQ